MFTIEFPSHVSPEFRLRPLLSGYDCACESAIACCVAGVQAPAFVERRRRPGSEQGAGVSPEFRLRPLLSAALQRGPLRRRDVSPEFRLRPLLSAHVGDRGAVVRGRVAGVQAPAFVERTSAPRTASSSARVSPEFRLRPLLSGIGPVPAGLPGRPVSPEFRLRPLLSGLLPDAAQRRGRGVSPEFRLRPLLSARRVESDLDRAGVCRRSSGSGLC